MRCEILPDAIDPIRSLLGRLRTFVLHSRVDLTVGQGLAALDANTILVRACRNSENHTDASAEKNSTKMLKQKSIHVLALLLQDPGDRDVGVVDHRLEGEPEGRLISVCEPEGRV